MGNRIGAELRSIAVTVAQHNEKKGDIDFNLNYSQSVPDLWKVGLEDSLNRALAFSDNGTRKVNLRVKILKFDMPAMGVSMETSTTALYEIQDRETGDIIFREEISAEGVVGGTYAFVGAVRAMESANRSVQNNILAFLKVLEQKGIGAVNKIELR